MKKFTNSSSRKKFEMATNLTYQPAKACRVKIRAAGSDAEIIPVSRGARGIFVLPEVAD